MILPIIGYGDPILRSNSVDVDIDYPDLDILIKNMLETLRACSNGVGLSAPQIGKNINLFIVDSSSFNGELHNEPNFKKTFINPTVKMSGEEWDLSEGCLSIPGINEKINRPYTVEISYLDEFFNLQKEEHEGIVGRIIQHEYDHLRGVLFVDRLHSFRKHLIKNRLKKVSQGKIQPNYNIKFNVT